MRGIASIDHLFQRAAPNSSAQALPLVATAFLHNMDASNGRRVRPRYHIPASAFRNADSSTAARERRHGVAGAGGATHRSEVGASFLGGAGADDVLGAFPTGPGGPGNGNGGAGGLY